jgi:hypothetical protein
VFSLEEVYVAELRYALDAFYYPGAFLFRGGSGELGYSLGEHVSDRGGEGGGVGDATDVLPVEGGSEHNMCKQEAAFGRVRPRHKPVCGDPDGGPV